MARREGNVAPHDLHTTRPVPDLPMEEREPREVARARHANKRAAAAARSPFARRPGTDNARSEAVPALDEAKFTTPPLGPDVVEPALETPSPTSGMETFARPPRGDGTRRAAERIRAAGYAPHEVREWAAASGVACPAHGVVPSTVVDAFLADVELARVASGAAEQPPAGLADAVVAAVREAATQPAPVTEPEPDVEDEPIPYVLAPAPPAPGSRAAAVTALLAELADALADDLDATDTLAVTLDAGAVDVVRRALERIRRHTAVTRALVAERTPTTGADQ